MALENAALELIGEKALIPVGLAALIVMLAIWLTRLDDRVTYQEQRIKVLENIVRHSNNRETNSQGE